jgi:integrase
MARSINRLSHLKVAAAKKRGLYADGGGLYLQVARGGSKSWLFRFKIDGRTRDMGLGPLNSVSLANAREIATECRQQRLAGLDPIEARKAAKADARLLAARATTFDAARDAYIAAHEASWRNAKHGRQWRSTLATYATPVIGGVPVQDVDTPLVLKVLEPIWNTRTETASRVRGRIEAILDWAKARGLRVGENPARWRGHLSNLLPKRSKVRRVRHHPALPYAEMPAFITTLRRHEGFAPRALEFVIMTATRTGEGLGARWHEFDLEAGLWTIPAGRMKGGREHRVPLPRRVVAMLKELVAMRLNEFVFPGLKRGRPLGSMRLLTLLRDMEHDHITVHGFRSTFKDWASETTSFPDHLSEMALAHVSADKVRAAYARGDLFQKRRELMEAWASYCEPEPRVSDLTTRRTLSEAQNIEVNQQAPIAGFTASKEVPKFT